MEGLAFSIFPFKERVSEWVLVEMVICLKIGRKKENFFTVWGLQILHRSMYLRSTKNTA